VTHEGGGNSDASQLTRQTVTGIRSRHRERTLNADVPVSDENGLTYLHQLGESGLKHKARAHSFGGIAKQQTTTTNIFGGIVTPF